MKWSSSDEWTRRVSEPPRSVSDSPIVRHFFRRKGEPSQRQARAIAWRGTSPSLTLALAGPGRSRFWASGESFSGASSWHRPNTAMRERARPGPEPAQLGLGSGEARALSWSRSGAGSVRARLDFCG